MQSSSKTPAAIVTDEKNGSPRNSSGGEIWPESYCSCFSPRKSLTVPTRECWYCRHADFNLTRRKALDVGVCRWPAITIE